MSDGMSDVGLQIEVLRAELAYLRLRVEILEAERTGSGRDASAYNEWVMHKLNYDLNRRD
jgi:hypothetical protein